MQFLRFSAALLAALGMSTAAWAQTPSSAASQGSLSQGAASQAAPLTTDEAETIAREAYIYLYPLVTMAITRNQLTSGAVGQNPGRGPVNWFAHIPTFPDATMRDVVRPNFDTLYSTAWLDLTHEPMIVSVPDTEGRYYLLPMLDMWSDVFAVPGKRTSGTAAAHYGVVPKGWSGELPPGVERIEAPTPNVWIIGRTQTNGPADYPAVHRVQAGFTISPLSRFGKQLVPPPAVDDPTPDKTPPLQIVNEMPAAKYFTLGARLMSINRPHDTDWSTLARLKRIGIEPGKFDAGKSEPAALTRGAAAGLELMKEKIPTLARVVNGWQMNTDTMGVYGNYYLKRAIVAMLGLGANQPEDAIYPLNIADADGNPVRGENRYVLSFKKDEIPPVDAFWSLTMYDAEGFQVANRLNRFAIGDRDALEFNADGSLDLYVQHESPGPDRESNWLPAPESGVLGLTMRLYAPKLQALDGRWNPPAIRRVR
jgi:hypothetical protein